MSKKQFSNSNIQKGYYGYSSESGQTVSDKKGKPSKKSGSDKTQRGSVFGAILAVIQLLASVAFVGLILYKKLVFVTTPILTGIIAILLILLIVVFSMAQSRSSGARRGGKIISVIVIIILGVLIYLLAPIDRMSGKKVSTDPFVVFVSANDTFGQLSDDTNGRSDTNILAVVNPKTSTILMISTPRDYYVEIQAQSVAPNSFDKLTHVGLYGNGIAVNSLGQTLSASEWNWAQEVTWQPGNDALMNTLKELYNLNISDEDYHYVKINFTGFAELIDAMGGITVDVDEAFSTRTYASYGDEDTGKRETYVYNEGPMKMNGAEALTYARERHSFAAGDIQRNKNQVKVLNAMSDKLLSGTTLLHYNDIVDAAENSFSTDMDISSLVALQMQLTTSRSYDGWNIVSFSTIGQSSRQVLTWNGLSKSVVLQDEDSIARATDLINMTLNGEDGDAIKAKIDEYNKAQATE